MLEKSLTTPSSPPITLRCIEEAQEAWAQGIVAIGRSSDPEAEARDFIDKHYAYDVGPVLFKPTRVQHHPFRTTKSDALSYFVGGEIAEDTGFALTPFTEVRFDPEKHVDLAMPMALVMGIYHFTPLRGDPIKVEYTFGYIRDANHNLRIKLHHSSIPFVHPSAT